ncbi:MAG: glycosyltransferase family 9 protein [Candidatus Omnitrophica bacterium]|nr:glycosyltransferase family 9 protein [Candidatus Omnitrophota bacterium]
MRILIVNPYGIGDVLFSLPLLYTLRQAFSNGFISFLCNRRTHELVSLWSFLDHTDVFEKDEFRTAWRRSKKEGIRHLRQVIGSIREKRFDLVIDLSLNWQVGLCARLAGITTRVGFDYRGRGRFLTHRLRITGFHDKPVYEYYLDLLSFLNLAKPHAVQTDFQLPAPYLEQADLYLQQQGIRQGTRCIGIVPGGGVSWGPNAVFKQWPPDFFARTADELARRHQAGIILFGDAREADLCRRIEQRMETKPLVVAPAPSLPLLGGLLHRCELVVGNDSGPMHMAVCLGTKTVTIFGPVDGSVYGPMSLKPTHRLAAKALACRPCYQHFRFPPCPWNNACLRELAPEEILAAAETIM